MMRKPSVGPVLLLFVGLASGFITLFIGFPGSNVDRLVTGFLVIISAGFVTTGGLGIAQPREGNLYHRLPGLTLIVLGISSIVGGLVSFDPIRSTVNQGLQLALIAVLGLTGIVLILGGRRWVREREMREPLAILSGGLLLCLGYLVRQTELSNSSSMGLFLVLVALLSAVATVYAVPEQSRSL